MKKMWEEQVAPRLDMGGGGVLVTRTLKTVGIGESNVAEVVADLINNENPTLATYAKQDGVHLRIAAKADEPAGRRGDDRHVRDEGPRADAAVGLRHRRRDAGWRDRQADWWSRA